MGFIVPRSPGPTVQANRSPDVRNNARVDMSPVIGGIGRVGAAVNNVLEKEQQRIDTAKMAQARTALESWWNTQRDPNNSTGLSAYKGENALKAEPVLIGKLKSERDKIAMRMTKSQRAQFDVIADSFTETVRGSLNTYAGQQHEIGVRAANQALLGTLGESVIRAGLGGDLADMETRLIELDGAEGRINATQGLSDEANAQVRAVHRSALLRSVIVGSIRRSPETAAALYDKYGGKLTGSDMAEVERVLLPSWNQAKVEEAARFAVDGGFVAPQGGVTEQSVQAQADAIAKRFGVTKSSGKRGPRFDGDRSRHIHGMAADFAGKAIEGENGDKLIAYAKAQGYHVLDERTRWNEINPRTGRKFGTGPNIHIEWRGGQTGASDSLPEALERLRHSPVAQDARLLKQAERQVRDEFAYRKLAQAQADQERGDTIFAKVAKASPNLAPSKLLSAGEIEFLARNPEVSAAINRWRSLTADGVIVQDDPLTVDQLDRLLAADPTRFRAFPLATVADKLSGSTLLRMTKQQREMAAKPEKADQWATEAQIVSMAADAMGLDAKKTGEFRVAYMRAKRAWMEKEKREPDADEAQQIVNRLKLPFVKPGWFGDARRFGWEGAAAGYAVPADARQQIVAEARANGVPNPTDQQIVARYIDMQGDDL